MAKSLSTLTIPLVLLALMIYMNSPAWTVVAMGVLVAMIAAGTIATITRSRASRS